MSVNERNDAEGLRILIAHALKSVREIVTITDLDDRFTFVNQAFLDAFGYTRDEVLGQHVSLIGSPNNPAGLHAEIFAQSRLGGWKGELLNRTKAGREFPIALSTSCIRDGSGKILGLIGIAEDITLRRQAAEALVARTKQIEGIRAISEEILRELDLATVLTLIIQRAADLTGAGSGMVYLWDEEAQILLPAAWHGGGAWRKELRLRAGQGVAGTVALRREGMLVNDYRNSPYAQAITLKHSQISTVLGEPLLCRDALVGVIVVDKEGDGAAFTAKDRETLALFAAQAAIAIENARLHTDAVGRGRELEALLRATRSVMSGLDLQHILHRIVAEASQMAGTPHVSVMLVDKAAQVLRVAALAGDPVPVGFHVALGVDLSGLVAQAGQPVFSADSPNDPRNLLAERDRELGFVTYLGLPIKIRDEVLGVLTFDTTVLRQYSSEEVAYLASFADQAAIALENARLYEQIRRHAAELDDRVKTRTAELEEALRVKAQFLANMSHELRTPLNAVLGFSEVLLGRSAGAITPKQERYLRQIQAGGQRLLTLVSDLLEMTGTEGLPSFHFDRVAVQDLVGEVLEPLAGAARAKQVEMETHLDVSLPVIVADRRKLAQILHHLVTNAIRFTPAGGRVTVTTRRLEGAAALLSGGATVDLKEPQDGNTAGPQHWLEIRVTDTGIGIRAVDLERIFRGFEQVDGSDTRQYGGAGLGLALTKRLVELHGGRVWAESGGEGRGSTFTVLLPFAGPGT